MSYLCFALLAASTFFFTWSHLQVDLFSSGKVTCWLWPDHSGFSSVDGCKFLNTGWPSTQCCASSRTVRTVRNSYILVRYYLIGTCNRFSASGPFGWSRCHQIHWSAYVLIKNLGSRRRGQWMTFQAHGLLLWRWMRNQVFQDDVKERKGEEEEDIGDLHRCLIDNSLAPKSSSSLQCAICRTWFPGLFWNDGLLLRTKSSSLWKQATTNEIQDD